MKHESFEPSGSFFMLNENTMLGQGDCLELMKHIPDGSVDLILVDLPYATTQNKWDSMIDLEEMWIQLDRICKPNTAKLMFAQTPFDKILGCSNLKELKYEWIWEKTTATGHLNAKKTPMKAHENILVFYDKLPTYNPQKTSGHKPANSYTKHQDDGSNYGKTKVGVSGGGQTDRYPRSVQVFKTDKQKVSLHPTQKPVALLEYLINTYSNEGDTVLDFTFGSCSTGVACLNTNRRFVGVEMDEKYFDIGVIRMQESTVKGEMK